MAQLRFGSRTFQLPRQRMARIALGVACVIGGLLGFLPILGFWMLPLGILILSIDLAPVRRFRRRVVLWWVRRSSARSSAQGV